MLRVPSASEKNDLELLRRRADQGDAAAQYQLGGIYSRGEGVMRDSAEAFKLWCKAAHQGYRPACGTLGLSYEFGLGVKRDYTEAYFWYAVAFDSDASYQIYCAWITGRFLTDEQKAAVDMRVADWLNNYPALAVAPSKS